MMNQEHARLIEQVFAYVASHEIDKLLGLFAEDAVFEDVPLEIISENHAKLREMYESMFVAMPDFTQTVVSVVADDHSGSAEWIQSGTFSGDFLDLSATGKPFSVRGAAIVRIANGRISRWTDYWSKTTFKEQVGLA